MTDAVAQHPGSEAQLTLRPARIVQLRRIRGPQISLRQPGGQLRWLATWPQDSP